MNAPEYERMFRLEDSYWWFVGRHRLVEKLLRTYYGAPARAPGPLQILDIGCGTGAMSRRLQAWGTVISADFSALALRFSQRRGLRHLVCADALRLPFPSCAFDVLIAMDILEHLRDDAAALREFNRVLKPGGRLFATVPAYPHLWSEHDEALMHFRRYRRPELAQRLTANGLRIEKLSHTMTALYPIVALQRRLSARTPPRNPPQAAMPAVPALLNAALIGLLEAENILARRLDLPFGVTLLSIARKPGA